MTFKWSEKGLEWLVYRDGQLIDRVGMQYAEQHPNWKHQVETYHNEYKGDRKCQRKESGNDG